MELTGWKKRLREGIDASGMSDRAVSIASGNGPGYVHSLLVEGKDPTVQKLMRVCEAAGLSLVYVLEGLQMDRQTEQFLTVFERSSVQKRRALLDLLEDETASEPSLSAREKGAPSTA